MKYDDIIDMPRPEPKHHTRQDRLNRAKIFAPFAALKGYEEAIEARKYIKVPHSELSELALEELNDRIEEIIDALARDEHPIIKIIYREPRSDEYISFTGMVAKITLSSRILQVVDRKIDFENIRKIDYDVD